MKKIFKVIFAISLVFMLNLRVNAITITTDNTKQGTTDTNSYLVTNKGNITINNIGYNQLKAYKIIDYYYNSTSDELSYEFTNDFKTFLATTTDYKNLTIEQYRNLTSGDINNGSNQSPSTLDKLVSLYATYTINNEVENNDLITTPYEEYKNGSATGNFEVGSYLVLEDHSTKLYAVMVGNIELKKENDTWTIADSIINAKVDSTAMTKTIVSGAELKNEKYYINNPKSIINRLTIAKPEFPTNSENHIFGVIDTEEVQTALNIKQITIKDGTKEWNIDLKGKENNYKEYLKDDNNNNVGYLENILGAKTTDGPFNPTFIIKFNSDYIKSDSIIIEYETEINEEEAIDHIGKNGFHSLYGMCVDPYASTTIEEYQCGGFNKGGLTLYSYGIKINTKDSGNNNLENATYKLYSDSTLNTEVGTFTTNGSISTLIGLAPGKYYVKQTSSPSGASLNNEVYTVNIPESQEGYVELTVTNNASLLPVTGGTGTLIFGIVGLLVIIGAIAYYKINKKKKINSEA